ncbi:MAG TPA: outer membrane protein assembly factor BamA [Gemmatimonadales bacterium]|nr:outer membrane protein assembly factor BamA [Gemmatimonadales bacterium]
MRVFLLTGVLASLLAGAGRAHAQEPAPASPADSIVVVGAVRNSPQQIISFAGLALHQPVTYRVVQRAIQALFVTGQFDDVRVDQRQEGGRLVLVIVVKERPLLQKWTLKGVVEEDEGVVRRKINLPEGRPLDRAALERSRHAVDSLYHKRGYYAVQIKTTELPQENNQVRLIIEVTPGPRVVVSRVEIEGNSHFKDKEVVKGMVTRPEGFWWYQKGEYSEEKVEDDIRNSIPNWYADHGHVDLRVLSDTLIADSVPGKAIVRVKVDEGQAYQVGRFEVVGNRRFSVEEISTFFPFGKAIQAGDGKTVGDAFSRSAWASATDKLVNLYQNNGYIYSSVSPEETRRTGPDSVHYVDLKWNIREGQPATVNRIIILGNDVTHERVIREAIVLLPGQTFNRDALIRSYQNVSNLNFFQQPLPPPEPVPTDNGVDVDVVFRVTERRTGNINFGASVGQGVGIGGFIGLEEPNLFGRAKRGKLQWQFGRNINDFNLSYTDPAVLDSRTSATITLFNSRRRYTIGDLGRQRQRGFQNQVGFPLFGSRYTRVYASWGLQQIRYSDAAADLSRVFACDNCTRSSVGLSVARDTRIGLPFAVAGSSVTIGGEQNGGVLGGTGNYRKLDLEGRWYTPLGRAGGADQFGGGIQFTLGLTAKSGFIMGDTGPFYTELYSMGGVQYGIPLRGYEEFAITPTGFDAQAGGSQARPESFGKAYAAFTVEAGARVSQAIYLNVFTDAGNVYQRAREYNPTRLFRSVGVGVAVISPLGPLGVDLGYGLDKTDLLGKPKPGWQLHFRLGNFF